MGEFALVYLQMTLFLHNHKPITIGVELIPHFSLEMFNITEGGGHLKDYVLVQVCDLSGVSNLHFKTIMEY